MPVVPRSSRTVIVENSLKSSLLWPQFNIFKLTKTMRARAEEHEFTQWLLSLGNDNLVRPQEDILPHAIEIPESCTVPAENECIEDSMFSNFQIHVN